MSILTLHWIFFFSQFCLFISQETTCFSWQFMSWATLWAWSTPMTPLLSWPLSTSTWRLTTFSCPVTTCRVSRRSMVSYTACVSLTTQRSPEFLLWLLLWNRYSKYIWDRNIKETKVWPFSKSLQSIKFFDSSPRYLNIKIVEILEHWKNFLNLVETCSYNKDLINLVFQFRWNM